MLLYVTKIVHTCTATYPSTLPSKLHTLSFESTSLTIPVDSSFFAMDTLSSINATKIPHPFYPIEAEIVGYLANEWSVPTLLGVFAAGWAIILGITSLLVKRHNPSLPSREKAAILWFVLCKFHQFVRSLVVDAKNFDQLALSTYSSKVGTTARYTTFRTSSLTEAGYFSLNHTRMGGAQDLFGQLWKEYSLSDSRYLTSDPFVLCMETVTAVSDPAPIGYCDPQARNVD